MKRFSFFWVFALALSCAAPPEGTTDGDCADASDNDGNGFVDCEDPGCRLDDGCVALAAKAAVAEEKARQQKSVKEERPPEAAKQWIVHGGLWIQRAHNGSDIDRDGAVAYCDRLVLGDRDDWRLPSQAEAIEAVNSRELPGEPLVMWTSTEIDKKRGVIVGITSGAVNDLGLRSAGQCRARCVRDDK